MVYENPYFSTSQNYMSKEAHSIWVFEKVKRKKDKVTLRVSSDKRDHKKTEQATGEVALTRFLAP